MRAHDFASEVERLLRRSLPVPPPAATELVRRAQVLDTALGGPAGPDLDAAKQQMLEALGGLQDDIRSALADAVPLPAIRDLLQVADLTGSRPLDLSATLGPLHVEVRSPTVTLVDPHDASVLELGPLPPNAFTARLDAGPVKGGGALARLPDGLAGVLAADLGFAQVAALASLRRDGGDPSFLAVLSAGFTPGIQLGFGFQISRLGGAVGINRSLDADALARGIADGSAARVLFPLDIGKDAPGTLQAAEALLPPAVGSAVAGPTVRLSWLEVAGKGFLSADIGVLVELPGPRRVALVGVVRAGVEPVVRINANVAGVVDLAQQLVTLDAALVDSGVLGVFTIYGDLAFAASWGPVEYTVLSIGGFYPGFRPEPAQLRPLKRLGLSLDSPLPGLRLRAEGYVAATSNTLQLGGRLDVGYDAGIASLSGFLGVDALVQFSPFHIHAEIAAGLDVRFLGQTFCGVSLHGTIDAPGPVILSGRLTVETFLKDFELEETWVFGSTRPIEVGAAPRAAQVVADQVTSRNLRAVGGGDPLVRLLPIEEPGERAVVTARNGVEWRQHVLPLDTRVDRVNGTPVDPAIGSDLVRAGLQVPGLAAQPIKDRFAPGSFVTLTAAQALNGPTYDDLPAGLAVTGGTVQGAPIPADNALQVLVKVRQEAGSALAPIGAGVLFGFAAALLAMVAERDLDASVASITPMVTIEPTTWTAAGVVHESATQAMAGARASGGFAVPTGDHDRPVALLGL